MRPGEYGRAFIHPPFAWHPGAPVMVCAEEGLVLAYDSRTEGPLWSASSSEVVAALACGPTHLYALGEAGTLSTYSLSDGQKVGEQFFSDARTVVVTPSGTPAVVCEREVAVDSLVIPALEGVHVAFTADGAHVLTVGREGTLRVFDVRTGVPKWQHKLGPRAGQASRAVWSPRADRWLIASENQVMIAPLNLTWVKPAYVQAEQVVDLAIDTTGTLLAVRAGKTVRVISVPEPGVCAQLSYDDKQPGQMAFGYDAWLGIGLNAGDANKVDLLQAHACHRTDPHPGRPRNRWVLSVEVSPERTRKALAQSAAAAVPVAVPLVKPAASSVKKDSPPVIVTILLVVFLGLCILPFALGAISGYLKKSRRPVPQVQVPPPQSRVLQDLNKELRRIQQQLDAGR